MPFISTMTDLSSLLYRCPLFRDHLAGNAYDTVGTYWGIHFNKHQRIGSCVLVLVRSPCHIRYRCDKYVMSMVGHRRHALYVAVNISYCQFLPDLKSSGAPGCLLREEIRLQSGEAIPGAVLRLILFSWISLHVPRAQMCKYLSPQPHTPAERAPRLQKASVSLNWTCQPGREEGEWRRRRRRAFALINYLRHLEVGLPSAIWLRNGRELEGGGGRGERERETAREEEKRKEETLEKKGRKRG